MTGRFCGLKSLVTFLIKGIGCLSLSKFGHLPDEISRQKIKQSVHFRKGRCRNLYPTVQVTGQGGFLKIMWNFYFGKHPHTKPQNNIPAVKTNLKELPLSEDVLIWFGHSSVYWQINGKRFLVDPVFSNNASPLPHNVVPFKGSNIYSVEDLPEIDYLLITHDHYDHLDYDTIKVLKPKVRHVITGLGVGSHFRYWGYNESIITEMDWDEKVVLDKIKFYCLPSRHFSGRLLSNRTMWASFLLEINGYKIYIGGDSGYDDHYKLIGQKFGKIDFAMLEAGQYDKNWRYIHEMPEEFISAAVDLQAQSILPVHNSKFSICNHLWYEPLEQITFLAENTELNIKTPKIGQIVQLRDVTQQFSQWWKNVK